MTTNDQTLAQLPLFARLGDDARRKIAPYVHEHTFSPAQTIVLAGEPCRAVYFVVRGVVRTYRLSREGREQVLTYLGPGEVFNLVPALDGEPGPVSVDSLSETTLYVIPCERFRQIVRKHHDLALDIIEQLATEVRRLSDMVEDLALHPVRARLARFLLAQAKEPQPGGGVGQHTPPRPSLRWTQAEIAAHIGTVREMVGRTLRAFAVAGMIRREHGRIVVVKREELEREAMSM